MRRTPVDQRTATLLNSLDARIAKLEDGGQKSIFKKITQNASAGALFLGIVLSGISLYDALVVKPELARVNRISQFNQAVNSAAKTRQDLLKLQSEIADPVLRMQVVSAVAPQILNDISTARAILRDLKDDDVEIPQLVVLISESAAVNDMASVGDFVNRAVAKQNLPPSLMSEAKRFQGKYLFSIGNFGAGRRAYQESVAVLGNDPRISAARAYVLEDWALSEFGAGDCKVAVDTLRSFGENLHSFAVPPNARVEMTVSFRAQLLALQQQHCPLPAELDSLLPNIPGAMTGMNP